MSDFYDHCVYQCPLSITKGMGGRAYKMQSSPTYLIMIFSINYSPNLGSLGHTNLEKSNCTCGNFLSPS